MLWCVFLAAHLISAVAGWLYPSQPMGDVVLVYEPWSADALAGGPVVGISDIWVYPQLALLPMLLTKIVAAPLVALLGVANAYLVMWAVLVVALDAAAFSMLVGRSPSRARRAAAWFWCAAVLFLGPIALYRIDAVAVPLAVVGGLWLVRRPVLGAALLTVGAWIKIWPGALVLAAVVAARARVRILLTAMAVTGLVVVLLLVLGADREIFGFLTEQTGRGLQIEAVAATPFLWLAAGGEDAITYSFEMLTFQIDHPGATIVGMILTPLMLVMVAVIAGLGCLKSLRGASFPRLFPPLALSLVTALIVANKVGSPQFQTWLIAPVVLWFALDRRRAVAPAALVLVLCGLTCLVYPLTYDALLRAELLPVLLLSARNLIVVVLLLVSIRALVRVPAVRPSNTRE